jgi:hypothetical protein
MREKEIRNRNYDAAFGTISEVVRVFTKASRIFVFVFLSSKAA